MNEKLNTSKIIMNWFYVFQGGVGELRGQRSSIFSPLQRLRQLGYRASIFCVKLVSIRSMTLRKFAAFLNVSKTFPVFEQLRK